MRAADVLRGGVMAMALAGCGSAGPSAEVEPVVTADPPPPPRPQWPAWGTVPWPTGDGPLEVGLRQAELHRDPSAEAIDRAWHHHDPAWRARAAWTLARIGGPAARDRLIEALGDGRTAIDAATLGAYALLEGPAADEARDVAWDELEDRLWTRYAVTEDAAQADALLLAIARVGGPRTPGRLAADLAALPPPADEPRHVHGMEALAISCVRGHALPASALEAVAQGLSATSAELRGASAYALAKCAVVSAEQLAGEERGGLVERLAPMTTGGDPASTRRAWWALEGLGELPGVVPGAILGARPIDWMTEVAAVRALVAHADGRKVIARRLPQLDLAQFQGPRLHVLADLLARLRPFVAHEVELEAPLAGLLAAIDAARGEASVDPARAKALTLIACEARLLLATRSAELEPLRACARGVERIPDTHGERLVIEALVHMGPALPREQRDAALLRLAVDPRPEVASVAVGALAGLDDPQIALALRVALAHPDLGVAAAAAGAIASRASDRSRRDPAAVPSLLDVVHRFDDDHAVETRIAAIDALGRLARSEPAAEDGSAGPPSWLEREIVPLAGDRSSAVRSAARGALRGQPRLLEAFEAAVPSRSPEAFDPVVHEATERLAGEVAGLRLHTDVGAITIDFAGAPAPIAQANLAALAERGFFDGLGFHRVVPGFVIQGGDPRGDGYGGPGYVMPCEWSTLRYERGTVGIALAGKDTGGSQLFITHDAARHLDARYTVIGRVVEGIDVVDAIWPYDRIERVERLRELPGDGGPIP